MPTAVTATGKSFSTKRRAATTEISPFASTAPGVVTRDSGVVPNRHPRTKLYQEFGKDAMTAHYSRARCAADALYRDPRGAIELALYPARGIVLWPDQYG